MALARLVRRGRLRRSLGRRIRRRAGAHPLSAAAGGHASAADASVPRAPRASGRWIRGLQPPRDRSPPGRCRRPAAARRCPAPGRDLADARRRDVEDVVGPRLGAGRRRWQRVLRAPLPGAAGDASGVVAASDARRSPGPLGRRPGVGAPESGQPLRSPARSLHRGTGAVGSRLELAARPAVRGGRAAARGRTRCPGPARRSRRPPVERRRRPRIAPPRTAGPGGAGRGAAHRRALERARDPGRR